MPFLKFRDRRRRAQIAHDLYLAVINQARLPAFYMEYGVPDTLDGRFDLIVLHAALVMRRLRGIGDGDAAEAKEVAQALFDLMFADMDQNLREIGVTDTSVGKRVKQMVRAFYGRATAYEEALNAGGAGLGEALRRNLYGTVEGDLPAALPAGMARYLMTQEGRLTAQNSADLMAGRIAFSAPESLP